MITSRAQEIYSAEFDRMFFKLPEKIRARLEAKISELGTKLNSFPHHRLKGSSDCRLRVGDYRVIYNFWKIPKGFHPSAQGCAPRATLGERSEHEPTLKGLHPCHPKCRLGFSPFRIDELPCRFPSVARSSQRW